MIKKSLTITLITCSFNTGCSMISERFSGLPLSNQNVNIETTKTMLYDFIAPRREPASHIVSEKSATLTTEFPTYFSASGYQCRVISSNRSRPICFVNGTWQEAAPIFHSKAP